MQIKNKIRSRYFLNNITNLASNTITIDANNNSNIHHHMLKVMRSKIGDYFSIFNADIGEYLVELTAVSKKSVTLLIINKIKNYEAPTFVSHIAYAPLKKDASDTLLEKTTEIGVVELTSIITDNTVNKPIEIDKINIKTINASEQCGRLSTPIINNSINLLNLINSMKNSNNLILWLNEKRIGDNLYNFSTTNLYKKYHYSNYNSVVFIIGPEGGFSNAEHELLHSSTSVVSCFIPSNTLTSPMAAICALLAYQIIYSS